MHLFHLPLLRWRIAYTYFTRCRASYIRLEQVAHSVGERNMTNCKNCGAPLQGGTCQYCGTRYDLPKKVTNIHIEETRPGELTLAGAIRLPIWDLALDRMITETAANKVYPKIAKELAEAILPYVDVHMDFDEINHESVFTYRLKVIEQSKATEIDTAFLTDGLDPKYAKFLTGLY